MYVIQDNYNIRTQSETYTEINIKSLAIVIETNLMFMDPCIII